ncbi:uncharacterized protein [Montipora capricornis]|uniref:uncharacterized protein n=1 Tax=Montipora capricornis TaxID=246305 RepID=UPI0035F1EF16
MNHVIFKAREREVGKAIENVAAKSCLKAIETEKENTLQAGKVADSNGLIGIAVSYDMAWQRRNGGHNSNTGHGAVMGAHTGQVLDYGVRSKMCRICASGKKKKHDCRKNHKGSSKSMEPDVAVDLFQRAVKNGVKYNIYTGDDDATTQAHLRDKVSYEVEKHSDTVHTKRSLVSKLYALRTSKKFPGCSQLSVKVIGYLGKCFGYCIAQNKKKPQSLKIAIQNIVPHAFGKHQNCNDVWCRYKQNSENYRHSELPFGKDLHGDELEKALTSVFNEYSTDVVVKKLAPAANSQRNESLNNSVGSKNPKIRFYGGSESNSFRVACGISQKNEGQNYVCQTLEKMNIVPGIHCKKYCDEIDHKSLKEKIRKSSIGYKKRRSQLRNKNLSSNAKKEEKEGTTYQTGIGLNLDPTQSTSCLADLSTIMKNVTRSQLEEYEKLVPPYTPRPTHPPISYKDTIKYEFVVFDIETTSTGKDAQICQLSAINKSGNCFNDYILPTCNISHHASLINGLSIKTIDGKRTLLKDNIPVFSISLAQCLENFAKFIPTGESNSRTVLIGHNSTTFDTPTLLRSGGLTFKQRLTSRNLFFADSLRLIRALIKAGNMSLQVDGKACKPNLSAVFETLFQEKFDAHDALEDVRALHKILFDSPLNLTIAQIVNNSNLKPCYHAFADMQFLDERFKRMQTFKCKLYQPKTDDGAVKQRIVQKIAESGLAYHDLEHLFAKAGKEALVAVLSQAPTTSKSTRSPRGTNKTAILSKIVHHFESNRAD